MVVEEQDLEYLEEIRKQVCSRCVERPAGGPPCAPLEKDCGVELHLPALVHAIHEVRSDRIDPYLQHNREEICANCRFLHSSICPCPMDYLVVLLVQAVETVDERRGRRVTPALLPEALDETEALAEVERAYDEAKTVWTGCDWNTQFGASNLNLRGCTAAQAETTAQQMQGQSSADWTAAARWLGRLEGLARDAEMAAAAAVAAARASDWTEAQRHAYRAWALEFASGRGVWHGFPLNWQKLRSVVEAVQASCGERPTPLAD